MYHNIYFTTDSQTSACILGVILYDKLTLSLQWNAFPRQQSKLVKWLQDNEHLWRSTFACRYNLLQEHRMMSGYKRVWPPFLVKNSFLKSNLFAVIIRYLERRKDVRFPCQVSLFCQGNYFSQFNVLFSIFAIMGLQNRLQKYLLRYCVHVADT